MGRLSLLAALLIALGAGCKCRPAPLPGVTPKTHGPSALFDDDAGHPWNRVHAALFDRRRDVGVAPCALTDAGCLDLSIDALHRAPFVSQPRALGGDEPLAFIGGEVDFLARPERRDEALAAIAAAGAIDPTSNPVAATLLQTDLWERFDALEDALATEQTPGRDVLGPLLDPLGKLIGRLALPEAALQALPGNLVEIEGADHALVPGLTDGRWVELRKDFTERPGDPEHHLDTHHAQRWGHRVAFRVLAGVPDSEGGLGWLRGHLTTEVDLPAGSTLALVGSPLAVSREGTVVPLPWVTLIELRRARREAAPPQTLRALNFDVLEGKRALLRASPRPGGGLVHLEADALMPVGATCLPDRSSWEPLAVACVMCHGATSTRITGSFAHGELRLFEEQDPQAAAREVARLKTGSKSFARLQKALGR